jgi:hypothetical protein
VTVAQPIGGKQRGTWVAVLTALVLGILLMLSGGCQRQAAAPASKSLSAVAPTGRLQEVSAPGAVATIKAALANRHPQLQIVSPADGALLAAGPWTLSLKLIDWPLAEDPSLGLGPHLLVQVDDGPGERIADWLQGDASSGRLDLAMAELEPGSHRITVSAALPWGEVLKQPGASAQRLVHRVAANPIRQPAQGSAQLLAVSPDGLSPSEPILIDWLLRDAPLQGLREGDARWRLRVSVNGDSFLVDQNAPLWLRGFKPGSNALLMELLDSLGDPLNPPFNSLVREVVLQAGATRPIWLNERISAADLARLLGEAPPELEAAEAIEAAEAAEAVEAVEAVAVEAEPPVNLSRETRETPAIEPPQPEAPLAAAPQAAAATDPEPLVPAPTPEAETAPVQAPEQAPEPDSPASTAPPTPPSRAPAPMPPAEPAAPLQTDPSERIQPSSSLSGSARQQVREDGSLIQARQPGPLSGLAARLRP